MILSVLNMRTVLTCVSVIKYRCRKWLALFFIADHRPAILSYIDPKHYKQFFSYPATVTITDDRAANLDLCLVLTPRSAVNIRIGDNSATASTATG